MNSVGDEEAEQNEETNIREGGQTHEEEGHVEGEGDAEHMASRNQMADDRSEEGSDTSADTENMSQ